LTVAPLEWLRECQPTIEKRLAERHLQDNAHVYYNLSSFYYTGRHCPLPAFGHDRDGKTRFPSIVYGLLANDQGCPVAMQVYPGNTADPAPLTTRCRSSGRVLAWRI
jgi:transposase